MKKNMIIEESLEKIIGLILELETKLNNYEKSFLSMEEASDYLGISINTLYGYCSRGLISFHKVQNRKNYFKREDLDGFVLRRSNRVSSKSEIKKLSEI